jgi:hypothetical protein
VGEGMPNSKHDELRQVFQSIIAEATPDTPSGSHKVFVVGQLVVNMGSESRPKQRCRGGNHCCEKCVSDD